jgi:hypothetical protein
MAAAATSLRWLVLACAWLSSHRTTAAIAAAVLLAVAMVGAAATAGFAGAVALVLLAWRLVDAGSFDRCVGRPAGRVRRRGWYRREWRWAAFEAGLIGTQAGGLEPTSSRQITGAPRLRGVHCERMLDWLEFRPPAGQTIEQWQDACGRLAKAFGARKCDVVADHDGMFLLSVVLDGHDWPTSTDDRRPELVGGVR